MPRNQIIADMARALCPLLLLRARRLVWARQAIRRHNPGTTQHTEAREALLNSARPADREMAG